MPNAVKIKRKITTGAPTTGQLAIGELCWNDVDKDMYIRDDDGVKLLSKNYFGTSATPPSAAGVPEGSIYFQYED